MSVYTQFGRAGNERGSHNEKRVLHALESLACSWVHGVRYATNKEDARGIDIVVTTDVGKLFLQVKSSRTGVRSYVSKKRAAAVGVVKCTHRMDDSKIRDRVFRVLERLRKQVLIKRGDRDE